MKIRNLTPHEITIMGGNGAVVRRIPADGKLVARLVPSAGTRSETLIDGIRVIITPAVGVVSYYNDPAGLVVPSRVENLPEQEDGTWLIVSRAVALATGRGDLLVPGEQVRDGEGRVTGCACLERFQA